MGVDETGSRRSGTKPNGLLCLGVACLLYLLTGIFDWAVKLIMVKINY